MVLEHAMLDFFQYDSDNNFQNKKNLLSEYNSFKFYSN